MLHFSDNNWGTDLVTQDAWVCQSVILVAKEVRKPVYKFLTRVVAIVHVDR